MKSKKDTKQRNVKMVHIGANDEVAQERIKIKDAAGFCMVSQTTVRRWIENGQLRAMRLPSGHYRISQADYSLFLKECRIIPEKKAGRSKSRAERGKDK